MKVVHQILRYPPETIDGIVVYVQSLIKELQNMGIENKVTAPIYGTQPQYYRIDKTEVYRYPYLSAEKQNKQNIHQDIPLNEGLKAWIEPHVGIEHFTNWLEAENPDIYHLHNWKPSCGIFHLRIAKQLGIKAIVTLHAPAAVCSRAIMMLNGKEPCDGKIEVSRCRRCCGSSLPAWLDRTWTYLPESISSKLPETHLTNALKNITLVDYRRKILLEMSALADKIVMPCQWLYDALLINGMSEHNLVVCRHGVENLPSVTKTDSDVRQNVMRVGFLGRWNKIKGLDILVRAIRRIPKDIPIELIIHAFAHCDTEKAFRDRLISLIAEDPRIKIEEPVSREQIAKVMASFDLLAVPSMWLEAGPLVVLEAKAVGVPVLGSGIGGIAELVNHGIDGWLVSDSNLKSDKAWSEALIHLASDRDLIVKLKQNIKPVRTMSQVAKDILNLYRER